jgi:hypothetical protein
MKIQTKHIIIGASVLIAGVAGWAYWRKKKGEEIKADLMAKLANSVNKTGTVKDVKEGGIQWSSVVYWSKFPESVRLKNQNANDIAKVIYNEIHAVFNTNVANILLALRGVKNQAAASHVSREYMNISNNKQTFLQGLKSMSDDKSAIVVKYLNGLPLK